MSRLVKRQPKQHPAIESDAQISKDLGAYVDTLEQPPRTFSRGQIITGNVVAFNRGEILVDVGGRAEGVVMGKEMKLDGQLPDKKEGDEVLVYVIKGENDKGQIELSIRRTGSARKWYELKEAQDGDVAMTVKALEANTGGLIVDVGSGLRGFIPTSQLDSGRIFSNSGYNDKEQATQDLQNRLADLVGEEIEVKIIEIDREKNRVIFSEKLITSGADLEKRAETLASSGVGDDLEANVTGIAPFGLFVNAEGLEGLVHLSEISWDKVANPADFYNVGDKVNVQIIGIQDDGKRVAYSIKRLLPDPWDELVKDYEVGQKVKGEVTKVVDYGAFVRIGDGLNGLVHISELSDKLVKDPGDIVKEGQEYELVIISISKEDRHLGLSLKRASGEATPQVKRRSASKDASPEMETLRDILGDDDVLEKALADANDSDSASEDKK